MAGANNKAGRKSGGTVSARRFQQASQAAKGRAERAVGRAEQVQERAGRMSAANQGSLTYVAKGRRGVVPVRVGQDPGIRKRANRAMISGITAQGFLQADSSARFQAAMGRATRMSSQRSNRGYRAPQTRLY